MRLVSSLRVLEWPSGVTQKKSMDTEKSNKDTDNNMFQVVLKGKEGMTMCVCYYCGSLRDLRKVVMKRERPGELPL